MSKKRKVALFVTCLADLFRPSVAFAAIKLLEDTGCSVDVPSVQTCCGQPAYNAGDRRTARKVAAQVIEAFDGFDYVVAPSGSCAGMIKRHIPTLFDGDDRRAKRARSLAAQTFELVSFLVDVCGVTAVDTRYSGAVTYHDSCSSLRELGVREQPRLLLGTVRDLELRELPDSEVCCGFGGTFCVKYPEISNRMVSDKIAAVAETGAGTLLAGDLGCLMNIAGKLSRQGSAVRARHVAEVLAGMTNTPAIGASRTGPEQAEPAAGSGEC